MMPSSAAVPLACPITSARTVPSLPPRDAQRVRDDLLPLVTTVQIGCGSERLPFRKLIALPGDAGRACLPHGIGLGGRLRARA